MPKQTYSLEPGGAKRLEISWKSFFKNTNVVLDGRTLGVIPDQKALMAGQEYTLPDGGLLKVQLVSNLAGSEVRVTRNDEPLPGSSSNPETRVKTAVGIIFFVAGLNLLLGLIAILTQWELLYNLGIGWYSVIFGVFFLVMGFLVKNLSKVALIFTIVVFALDGLLGLIGAAMAGSNPVSGVLVRILLLIPMVQAVKAITALKQKAATSTPPVYIPPA